MVDVLGNVKEVANTRKKNKKITAPVPYAMSLAVSKTADQVQAFEDDQ